jgi:hypothetical protein
MGAPSPDVCNLWLARAFNAQDVDAAAAMYHPEASIAVPARHAQSRLRGETARSCMASTELLRRREMSRCGI